MRALCIAESACQARFIRARPTGRIPLFGYAYWRPKTRVYRALINTLLQRGVIGRPDVLNRFSGFHHPKPLKRLRFNGLACTQLKQGVNETDQPGCSKTGMRRGQPPGRLLPSWFGFAVDFSQVRLTDKGQVPRVDGRSNCPLKKRLVAALCERRRVYLCGNAAVTDRRYRVKRVFKWAANSRQKINVKFAWRHVAIGRGNRCAGGVSATANKHFPAGPNRRMARARRQRLPDGGDR